MLATHVCACLVSFPSIRFLCASFGPAPAEFEALASGVQQQRAQLDSQCKALLAPLRQQWEGHTGVLLAGGEGWQRRGAAAAAALSAARELMHVLQDFEGVEEAITAFLSELHQAAAAIAPQLLSGPLAATAVAAAAAGGEAAAAAAAAGNPQLERWQLLGKNWERLLQVALVTMDRCEPGGLQAPAWGGLLGDALLGGHNRTALAHTFS